MSLIQCVLHTSPSSFEEQQVSSLILSCPEMRGSCLYRRVPCTVPCTYVHACRVLSQNLQYRMSHYEGPMATRIPHACPSVVTPCIGMLVSHYTYVHIPMDIRTYVHSIYVHSATICLYQSCLSGDVCVSVHIRTYVLLCLCLHCFLLLCVCPFQ